MIKFLVLAISIQAFVLSKVYTTVPSQTSVTKTYTLCVTYSQSYCGGARPPQVLIDSLNKPKPLILSKILLRSGRGKTVKVTTDKKGLATVALTQEEWCYMLTAKIDKSIPQINRSCKKALQKSYGTFNVLESSPETIDVHYHFTCDPCDVNSKRRQ